MSNKETNKVRMWATTDWTKEFPDERERLNVYNEAADLNLWEHKEREDNDVLDYIQSLTIDYWNEMFEGVDNLEDVVITGYFGTWNGPKEIVPCRCENIEQAINKCCDIRGQWDADVCFETDDSGTEHLVVYVHHHDGSCRYEISALGNPDEVDENDEEYKLLPISFEMVFGA